MSSSSSKPRRLSTRIAVWFLLSVSVSVVAVSATIYFLLSSSLRRADHEFIEARSLDYIQIYQRGGLSELRQIVAEQRREVREDELLISLEMSNNQEVFTYLPTFLDHDEEDAEELQQVRSDAATLPLRVGWHSVLILSNDGTFNDWLETRMRRFVLAQGWDNVLPLLDHDLFEIYIVPIAPDLWMKIGKNPEFREDHLMRVRRIGLMVLLPFLAFSALIGVALIWRITKPIHDMTSTIQTIRNGKTGARVKTTGREDELDQLAQQFNDLLDSNETLVAGMQQTLDNVAHDLRTPLTRFRMGAEMALQNLNDRALVSETLQVGVEATESMTALLNAIMEVARAQTGTLPLNKQPTSLKALLLETVDVYQYAAEDKGIRLEVESAVDVVVAVDGVRCKQLLGNLIDNALKYSPAGTTVTLKLVPHANEVEIQVRDQGVGIAQADLPRIFDRLYRADKSRSTPGMGIGLSLVQAVALAHGGRVLATGQEGIGSCFSVFLPR